MESLHTRLVGIPAIVASRRGKVPDKIYVAYMHWAVVLKPRVEVSCYTRGTNM